jgi:sugar-specific transcriptional regulator TrmB
MQAVITKLSELGLSEYESKAYLALLHSNPSTAYEIAKESGIPTSKIYQVIHKLTEKGICLLSEENGKTKRYIPIQPDEFLNRYKSTVGTLVDSLKEEFNSLDSRQDASRIWNISDYDHLIDKARRMIDSAHSVLLLSLWKEELEPLEAALRKAEERGVRIALVHFGIPKICVGQVYYHPIEDTLYAEKGGRGFVLISDSQEVLIGTVSYEGRAEGAWSRNKGFVMISEDYVKHDVYITKIIKRLDKELINCFGERYAKLRDVLRDADMDAENDAKVRDKGVLTTHETG